MFFVTTLNGHVGPAALRVFENPPHARLFVTRLDVENRGGPQLPCRLKPVLRRAYA